MPTRSERRQGRKSLAMQAKVKLNRDYLIRFHHHSSRLLCQQATRGKEEGNFSPLLQPRILPLPPTTYYLPTLLQPRILLLPPTTYYLPTSDPTTTSYNLPLADSAIRRLHRIFEEEVFFFFFNGSDYNVINGKRLNNIKDRVRS